MGAVRGLEFEPDAFQVFLYVCRTLHRRFLGLPDLLKIGKLLLQFAQLRFKIIEPLARRIIGFLFECLALDLQLNDAALQLIHGFRL